MIVDIQIPCYVDRYFPQTAFHMVKVLEEAGCVVNYPVDQTCCGLPAYYDGFRDECKAAGTKMIHEFQNDRFIVSCGTACVDMVRNRYPELFHNSVLHNEFKNVQRRIFEFSDFLVNHLEKTDFEISLPGTVFYFPSCTGSTDETNRTAALRLLRNLKGLHVFSGAELPGCCGWCGTYAVRQEEQAAGMADKFLERIQQAGADVVVSDEMGCLMHLQSIAIKKNIALRFLHIADVLAGEKPGNEK